MPWRFKVGDMAQRIGEVAGNQAPAYSNRTEQTYNTYAPIEIVGHAVVYTAREWQTVGMCSVSHDGGRWNKRSWSGAMQPYVNGSVSRHPDAINRAHQRGGGELRQSVKTRLTGEERVASSAHRAPRRGMRVGYSPKEACLSGTRQGKNCACMYEEPQPAREGDGGVQGRGRIGSERREGVGMYQARVLGSGGYTGYASETTAGGRENTARAQK
ncbi:hypothetical protein L227DRAFT_630261 [Lentinus tigrinus ALCF2SS1-6]|uniref:Uncharacterized protein n=1 Tax=Lentinus tigrinus ALCF2SS1-6 TaxID=1328759 RepID=A0A5C2S3B2_9APHY|nr:hypothetical protein L227DRAFT_630261 [Lentinus tigrinus ALCF2SS1-6]